MKERIEFIFSEFGTNRVNGGGNHLRQVDRLNPSLDSIKKFFPNANVTLYCDFDIEIPNLNIIKVNPIFKSEHLRCGYWNSDLFKLIGLSHSKSDVAIAIDSDMHFVSNKVLSIIPITKKFGFCLPANPRHLVEIDATIGTDGGIIEDYSLGQGYAMNTTPISFYRSNASAALLLDTSIKLFKKNPCRLPLVFWKASWKTGFSPYLLPPQWCVCQGNEGIGNEIILHVGHESVMKYYL